MLLLKGWFIGDAKRVLPAVLKAGLIWLALFSFCFLWREGWLNYLESSHCLGWLFLQAAKWVMLITRNLIGKYQVPIRIRKREGWKNLQKMHFGSWSPLSLRSLFTYIVFISFLPPEKIIKFLKPFLAKSLFLVSPCVCVLAALACSHLVLLLVFT